MAPGQYRNDYALSHDIDYFFRIDDLAIHVASNGSLIPAFINRDINYAIQSAVYEMNEHSDIEPMLLRYTQNMELFYITRDGLEEYVSSFSSMARKGFISIDNIGAFFNPESYLFLTVAWPSIKNTKLEQTGIISLLPDISESNDTRIISYKNQILQSIHKADILSYSVG